MCPCGYEFEFLDRVRQSEHIGFRYIGKSGLLYCSVGCAEEAGDTCREVTDGWVWDPAVA